MPRLRTVPSVTLDGERVACNINAGLLFDLPHLDQSGADGIGLFRTELQFMISATFPRLEQQTRLYKAILDAAGDRPVVFRSLDVGGDKVLPYLPRERGGEPGASAGARSAWRSTGRRCSARRSGRCSGRRTGRELRVMLPMIADVSELQAARALIDREVMILKRHGRPEPKRLMVGAMIEVPALLWQLDRVLPLADFASVGSNDLMQFLFAADRGNMRVAERFDCAQSGGAEGAPRDRRGGATSTTCRSRCAARWPGKPLEAMALVGARLPLDLHGAGLGRPGQGHDSVARCRRFARTD